MTDRHRPPHRQPLPDGWIMDENGLTLAVRHMPAPEASQTPQAGSEPYDAATGDGFGLCAVCGRQAPLRDDECPDCCH